MIKTILKVLLAEYGVSNQTIIPHPTPPHLNITSLSIDYLIPSPNQPPPTYTASNPGIHTAVLKRLLKILLSMTLKIQTVNFNIISLEDPRVDSSISSIQFNAVKLNLDTIQCLKITALNAACSCGATLNYITSYMYFDDEYSYVTNIDVDVDKIVFIDDVQNYSTMISNLTSQTLTPSSVAPPNPPTAYLLKISNLKSTAFSLISLLLTRDVKNVTTLLFHISLDEQYGFFNHDLVIEHNPSNPSPVVINSDEPLVIYALPSILSLLPTFSLTPTSPASPNPISTPSSNLPSLNFPSTTINFSEYTLTLQHLTTSPLGTFHCSHLSLTYSSQPFITANQITLDSHKNIMVSLITIHEFEVNTSKSHKIRTTETTTSTNLEPFKDIINAFNGYTLTCTLQHLPLNITYEGSIFFYPSRLGATGSLNLSTKECELSIQKIEATCKFLECEGLRASIEITELIGEIDQDTLTSLLTAPAMEDLKILIFLTVKNSTLSLSNNDRSINISKGHVCYGSNFETIKNSSGLINWKSLTENFEGTWGVRCEVIGGVDWGEGRLGKTEYGVTGGEGGWRFTGFRVEWFMPRRGWGEGNEIAATPQAPPPQHLTTTTPSFNAVVNKLVNLTSDLNTRYRSNTSTLNSLKSLLSKNEKQRVALSTLTSCAIEGYLIVGRGLNFNPKTACMHRFRPPYLIRYDGVTATEFLNLKSSSIKKLKKKGKEDSFQITLPSTTLHLKPLIGSSEVWIDAINRYLNPPNSSPAKRSSYPNPTSTLNASAAASNFNNKSPIKRSSAAARLPKMTWKRSSKTAAAAPSPTPVSTSVALPVPSNSFRVEISRNPPPPIQTTSQTPSPSKSFTLINFTLTLDSPPHLHTLQRSLGQFLHFSHQVLDTLPPPNLNLASSFDTATGESPVFEIVTTARQCSTAATVPEEESRVEILTNFTETVLKYDLEAIREEVWKFLDCRFSPLPFSTAPFKLVTEIATAPAPLAPVNPHENALMEIIHDINILSSETLTANCSYAQRNSFLEEQLKAQSTQHALTVKIISNLQPTTTTVTSPFDETLLSRLKTALQSLKTAKQTIAAATSKETEQVKILQRRLSSLTERYVSLVDGEKVTLNEDVSTFSESDMNLMLKQLQGEILERTKVNLELSMMRELEVIEKERNLTEKKRREVEIQSLVEKVKEEQDLRIQVESELEALKAQYQTI